MELRLAYFAAGFAEENVVVRVRVKGRVEVDEIDAFVRELVAVAQPVEVIAEEELVHRLLEIPIRLRNDKAKELIGFTAEGAESQR